MGCRRTERRQDAVVVVLGVRLRLGVPDHLLGIDHFAVDNGGDLPVGAAGVEADAAAAQVAADLPRAAAGGGKVPLLHGFQREGTPEYRLHQRCVKGPGAVGPVYFRQAAGQVVTAADTDPPAAHAPQQQLYGALQKAQVGGVCHAPQAGIEHGHLPLLPLHGDADGAMGLLQISVPPRSKGQVGLVQGWAVLHRAGDAQIGGTHHAFMPLQAASSQISVTSGWNCRMDAGTQGVTGPQNALRRMSALSPPVTIISTRRAAITVPTPMV